MAADPNLALVRTRTDLDRANLQLIEQQGTIDMLLAHMATKVTPTISTGITMLASGAAGVVDGAFGEQNKLGPIPLTLVFSGASAVAGYLAKDPDLSEFMTAAARGWAAPTIYLMAKDAAHKRWRGMLGQPPGAKQEKPAAPKPVKKPSAEPIA